MHGTSVLIGLGSFERDSLVADAASSLLAERAYAANARSLEVTAHPVLHSGKISIFAGEKSLRKSYYEIQRS